MKRPLLLTWDVEEFDAASDFGGAPYPDGGLARGVEMWREWLDLSRSWKFTGTIFTTARMAEAAPDLLRETAARGHEIASHGWSHAVGADLRLQASRERLSEISGQEVQGFRAPRLRAVPPEEIVRAGYTYDASLNPAILPGKYINWRHPRRPHQIGTLWEVPASVVPVVRFPLFWASFHLLPFPLYFTACRLTLAWDGFLSLYFHPWELSALDESAIPWWIRRRSEARRAARMEKLIRALGKIEEYKTMGSFISAKKSIP